MHDVVYEDVCIRDTKNPIYMDTRYTATVSTEQGRIPVFQDITLKNVRIEGNGKLVLDGFDSEHPLKMSFDNVTLDPPGSFSTTASHALLMLGPGPVNFQPDGEDVLLRSGFSARDIAHSCSGRFVPFPR